jgi:dynein heavy chain
MLEKIKKDKALIDAAYFLPTTKEHNDLKTKFEQVSSNLEKYISKIYEEWTSSLDAHLTASLNINLMIKVDGLLQANFDPKLLIVFEEKRYWQKLTNYDVPMNAIEISTNEDKLRVYRENVNIVMREYNDIIKSLVTEQRLFKQIIYELDRKIQPGLSTYLWSSKGGLDYFLTECRKACGEVKAIVDDFKSKVTQIYQCCNTMAETLLIKIENKKVYSGLGNTFEKEQQEYREYARKELIHANSNIVIMMKQLYEYFKKDDAEIQKEWWAFVRQVEANVDLSLRQTVKKSLQRLSYAINGESEKNSQERNAAPLFLVNVTMEGVDPLTRRPALQPSVQQLIDMVSSINGQLVQVIAVVPLLEETLKAAFARDIEREQQKKAMEEQHATNGTQPDEMEEVEELEEDLALNANYYKDNIQNDKEIEHLIVAVMEGMHQVDSGVEEYIRGWEEKYKTVWNQNKEQFLRRFAHRDDRPVVSFQQEITKYRDYQIQIQNEEPSAIIGYLQLDSAPLKHTLVMECNSWQNSFLDLLHGKAQKHLSGIYELFEKNTKLLQEEPQTLEKLEFKIELVKKLQVEYPRKKQIYSTVMEMYNLLENYERNVKEEENIKLQNLYESGDYFEAAINSAKKSLDEERDTFRHKLKLSIEAFVKSIEQLKKDFTTKGPYSADLTVKQAKAIISEYTNKVNMRKAEETKLRSGMRIFELDAPPYKEINEVAKDIDTLTKIWDLKKEWEDKWDEWKFGPFDSLDVPVMEQQAVDILKRNQNMGRDAREWPVWNNLKEKLEQFKRVLPLIQDLKNEALRPRHWNDVSELVHAKIDNTSKDFNLEKIFALGFENYVDDISNLSNSATQELNIERDINKISEKWNDMELDIVEYKSQYHRLNSTEDIFILLEDNMATLGAMKVSPFIGSFQVEVTNWEKILSRISETVEMILQVQKEWSYLLNIFEVEDIQKQLPNETGVFKVVNTKWKSMMKTIAENRNAWRATHREGLLSLLNDMHTKLEDIQKHLNDYLEIKRQLFPRFYFLSDADLLEILGQAKDPNAVQRHLENCFEGIHRLRIEQSNDSRQSGYFAYGMIGKDGETIDFNHPVHLEGAVEKWLLLIESAMRQSIKRNLSKCYGALKNMSMKESTNRDAWIKEWQGQMLITASQLYWTKRLQEALNPSEKEGSRRTKDKAPPVAANPNNPTATAPNAAAEAKTANDLRVHRELKKRKKEWGNYLKSYSTMVRGDLSNLNRKKLIALITMEVHAREVIEKLIKAKVTSESSFDWKKQLTFVWNEEKDTCVVRQTSSEIDYDYEYIGNGGRLVITPLTERCYMTLTTAIQLCRGGNPQGPAGTGKTETVKDLGKNIAKYVIVFNCSDGLDYKSLGRLFSGLVQTGAWSCFDEFNRIELSVLSVVAQQISLILSAVKGNMDSLLFEGQEIAVNRTLGIFVTMNPGYAGRSELPDNLKALLRPVSMMVPDSALICEIKLYSLGFEKAKELSRKIVTMYELMAQQLSQQRHYDFGLRNITAVLTAAGQHKRKFPEANEELLLLTSCKDMNFPKFVTEDIPLFNAIMGDLFPGVDQPEKNLGNLQHAIESELKSNGYQINQYIVSKAIQLYETKLTRHGVMVVGSSGAGKTTSWKILQKAITKLSAEKVPGFHPVHDYIINPKAITGDELYGNYRMDMTWSNGIFSAIMKEVCTDTKPDQKWIVFDGPVDTIWIESMNTVLDDNKVLTLISGDRISLTEQVSLLFEVQDLNAASPATVSRCGMVYFNDKDLGWQPFMESWFASRKLYEERVKMSRPDAVVELLRSLSNRFVQKALKARQKANEIITTTDMNAVQSLCNLFDSIATIDNGLDPKDDDTYLDMVQKFFVFSLIWSVGATIEEEGRNKMDMLFREFDPQFPSKGTVYEYFIDTKTNLWKPWDEKVNQSWKPNPNTPFYKILVPTVDTVRNSYIISSLIRAKKHVLVVGNIGTGKTATINYVLSQFDDTLYTTSTTNFSARTSSHKLQEILESKVEKKSFDSYFPFAGKQLILFIDDFNMPQKDAFGSQPPLELLRQWIDYGFWFDRAKQVKKNVKKMQLVCAMGPPGGGRTTISQRLQSRFNVLNIPFPTDNQIKRIYGSLLKNRLDTMEEVKSLSDTITLASIEMYRQVSVQLLPTPSKSHYIFNMRDLSKVFQGIIEADEGIDNKEQLIRLWVHECHRIFYDRLNNEPDRVWFQDRIREKLADTFTTKWEALFDFNNRQPTLFGTLLSDNGTYTEIPDIKVLKSELELKLEDYNNTLGKRPMNLVLFNDAIEHVCRIHRVIKQSRGNALLIGVGGSGRQSLTRLAAHIADYKVFMVELSSNFKTKEDAQVAFHNALKEPYMEAGVKKKHIVFLFSDTQIVDESFLEDVNSMLSSGEVPNMFEPEELTNIHDQCRKDAKEAGYNDELKEEVYQFFIERVRERMHIVVCMSPVGAAFRNRIRMFPALVNCTTIDWFRQWPSSALKEVATSFLSSVDLGDESDANKEDEGGKGTVRDKISEIFVVMHNSVLDASEQMLSELKRYNYVTPTNYLELVTGYTNLLKEKRSEIGEMCSKLEHGLTTLERAREDVAVMSTTLEQQKKVVAKSKKDCEDLMTLILQEKASADGKKQEVELTRGNIQREKEKANKIKQSAEQELAAVAPILQEATQALKNLDPSDISEIKNYTKPNEKVKNVLIAVMAVLKQKEQYDVAKGLMGNAKKFLTSLTEFVDKEKDKISDKYLNNIKQKIIDLQLNPEEVKGISRAAYGMCQWVIAVNEFFNVYKDVKPKQEKLEQATLTLERNIRGLEEAEVKLDDINKKIKTLSDKYTDSSANKEAIRKQAEDTELKLTRAKQLVGGLEGERERWTVSIKLYRESINNLIGDVLMAAAFMSYSGPFNGQYREQLRKLWEERIRKDKLPMSNKFSVSSFLAHATDMRVWNTNGLPNDNFSLENGVLVTRGRRWPLMIDPQSQANRWIKAQYKQSNLQIGELKSIGKLKHTLENAIKFGLPVLIQDINEDIDPLLEPILSQAIMKRGNREVIKIGDREIDYNRKFKLFLTTKLANPHYTPEISTKTTIVNFSVTKQGLEDQLLGIVVATERPELEEQKNDVVVSVANAKKRMEDLEDLILKLLTSSSSSSLLEDENLIQTLSQSKRTSEEIKQQLATSQETEKKIDGMRNNYRKGASRASVLYFVLCDLSLIDPMYQFSLDTYIRLFKTSIETSQKPVRTDMITQRVQMLNSHHTMEVYKTTCQGLFERHKLLFSFQMCVKILQESGSINMDEYNFFLRGGQVLDKETQTPNPCKWLTEQSWDNVYELDKLPNFHGIAQSFEDENQDWNDWFSSSRPEHEQLPSEWQSKVGTDNWAKMMIVRCVRPDRVIFMIKSFIAQKMESADYIKPPVNDIKQIFAQSSSTQPIIFVLSPGVDPQQQLETLAVGKARLNSLSLGDGMEQTARNLIEQSCQNGDWVFLANCHLMIHFMPQLEEIIEGFTNTLENPVPPHQSFRLFLSSKPHPKFPITILQKSRKVTTEPPQGIRSNLLRLYKFITNDQLQQQPRPHLYKKLLFALTFFHSVLLERTKFGTLGWNIPYDFNDSDFSISENILKLYLDNDKSDQIQWDALRVLIADVSYGGRVTDDMDRRILLVYANQFVNQNAVDIKNYKLSSDERYFIPNDGDLESYNKFISDLPTDDPPEAFGQHPNADISSQIANSIALLDSLISLTPSTTVGGKKSDRDDTPETRVYQIAQDLLEARIPEYISTKVAQQQDESALNTVLLQEISRYNNLLRIIKDSLVDLIKGIKGEVVMSSELEEVYNCLLVGKVPGMWHAAYASLKPLASWTRDLQKRVKQLAEWAEGDPPIVFWLPGFTFPSGFLTALKQTAARSQGVAVDELVFEYFVMPPQSSFHQRPKDGAYVSGLFLEGAGWDVENTCLTEPKPMQLMVEMPVIHFKPVHNSGVSGAPKKKSQNKDIYPCPLYSFPIRAGTVDRTSYITCVDLKSGEKNSDHWTKRGTALLMSDAQ